MASNALTMGITAFPVAPPPPKPSNEPEPEPDIDPKLLAIMKKYRYNWRLDQLSKMPEFKRVRKFVAQPVELIKATPKKVVELDPEVAFRCDHMSRTPLRYLVQNRRLHWARGKKFRMSMRKHIRHTWGSIYNHYRFLERRKELNKRRIITAREKPSSKTKQKTRASIEKERAERLVRLAQPKKTFGPPPQPPKPYRPIHEMKQHLDQLATPRERREARSRPLGRVNAAALEYEITPETLRLATTIPKRYLERRRERVPGRVVRAALKAQMTERLTALAQPKVRREAKEATDDGDDPWTISPTALKYKATPRILELAKPIERD